MCKYCCKENNVSRVSSEVLLNEKKCVYHGLGLFSHDALTCT